MSSPCPFTPDPDLTPEEITRRQHEQVAKWVRLAISYVGTQEQFAAELRRRRNLPTPGQPSVSRWAREGTFLEPEWWIHFEEITDFEVSRRELRPDIWPHGFRPDRKKP